MKTRGQIADERLLAYEKILYNNPLEEEIIEYKIECKRNELTLTSLKRVIIDARICGMILSNDDLNGLADSDFMDEYLYDTQTEILKRISMIERYIELSQAQDPTELELLDASGWL
ncbi:hypothetical protein BB987_09340 [Photorhabdus temperata]|uniref:Uncharacterized protein n=1 Tax=Photorhabdus khanii NC19 TaxID=1004151 RepID=W3V7M4_9GAMM|nr:hypothetical protein [Photorhabdus khanii]ETS31105.1 hypothetical protein PTE_03057 [Photorhabdus khanii NC19]OHV54910.1 hypothetical protein BB987_09340 [Photorhabdus temperata]